MIIQALSTSPELQRLSLPLKGVRLECGFPSPADDFTDRPLDLNEYLIKRPAATYFAWANGDSMVGEGINSGDLLIIDRASRRRQGSIVVASLDGQLTCKILDIKNRCFRSSNPEYPPIPVPDELDVVIEGVVTHVIRSLIP